MILYLVRLTMYASNRSLRTKHCSIKARRSLRSTFLFANLEPGGMATGSAKDARGICGMTSRQHYVSTSLGDLYVSVEGDARNDVAPVVFWPSLMLDHRLWAAQVRRFSMKGLTVAIDPPGHGRSMPLRRDFRIEECVECLLTILDELRIDRPHLVGNSWGAMTSAAFGAIYPDRVSSLLLITGTATPASPLQQIQFRSLAAALQLFGRFSGPFTGQALRTFLSETSRKSNPEAVEWVRKALAANDPRSLKHAIHSVVVNRPDRRQLFRRIVAPTIVVGGEEDGVFPPHEQEKLAEAIPGARLVVVPGVAHLVALEAPDTVNVMLSELVENGAVRG